MKPVMKGATVMVRSKYSYNVVTILTSGSDIRLRIRQTTVTITTIVMMSVTDSGNDQKLTPHLSSRSRLWASRKTGLVSRQMWKAKDTAVSTGFSLMLRLPNGISQKKIDLRDHFQLKWLKTTLSFSRAR